jgi:hypothetical protein
MTTTAPTAEEKDTSKEKVLSEKKRLGEPYMLYLSTQGYKPETDADGDIKFKKEGKTFFILIDEDDPKYFRVALPNFWDIKEENRPAILVSCNAASYRCKSVKVVAMDKTVWAFAEMFLSEPKSYEVIFERIIGALQYAVTKFTEEIEPRKSPEN